MKMRVSHNGAPTSLEPSRVGYEHRRKKRGKWEGNWV